MNAGIEAAHGDGSGCSPGSDTPDPGRPAARSHERRSNGIYANLQKSPPPSLLSAPAVGGGCAVGGGQACAVWERALFAGVSGSVVAQAIGVSPSEFSGATADAPAAYYRVRRNLGPQADAGAGAVL